LQCIKLQYFLASSMNLLTNSKKPSNNTPQRSWIVLTYSASQKMESEFNVRISLLYYRHPSQMTSLSVKKRELKILTLGPL
jgi:hypothetical protein